MTIDWMGGFNVTNALWFMLKLKYCICKEIWMFRMIKNIHYFGLSLAHYLAFKQLFSFGCWFFFCSEYRRKVLFDFVYLNIRSVSWSSVESLWSGARPRLNWVSTVTGMLSKTRRPDSDCSTLWRSPHLLAWLVFAVFTFKTSHLVSTLFPGNISVLSSKSTN